MPVISDSLKTNPMSTPARQVLLKNKGANNTCIYWQKFYAQELIKRQEGLVHRPGVPIIDLLGRRRSRRC